MYEKMYESKNGKGFGEFKNGLCTPEKGGFDLNPAVFKANQCVPQND